MIFVEKQLNSLFVSKLLTSPFRETVTDRNLRGTKSKGLSRAEVRQRLGGFMKHTISTMKNVTLI